MVSSLLCCVNWLQLYTITEAIGYHHFVQLLHIFTFLLTVKVTFVKFWCQWKLIGCCSHLEQGRNGS